MPGSRNYAHGYREVVSAPAFMDVGRGQVYHDFLSRDAEPAALEGCYGPEEAFLHGSVGEAHQMDADPQGDVYFHGYRNRLDTYAFCAVDI